MIKIVYALASTEFASVGQHRPWINQAPPAEDRFIQTQKAVDKWYPHALDTFGSAGSKFSELAVGYGIRKWGNEELRQMWRKDIDPQIEKIGLVVADSEVGRIIQ